MALLSIAEPGKSAAPHQHKLAVGIDLGTTNSLVATVRNSQVEILKDAKDRVLCPSIVRYLADGEKQVGFEALEHASADPHNTIVSVKRFIGKSLAEIQELNKVLPYNFSKTENGLPLIQTVAGDKNAVQVSADILSQLKLQAEARLGGELSGVVITVPAYFDDAQRSATKEAAKLAGLNVLRLLNEPTAAAVAYGINQSQEGLIIVYDLGGGTFDVSVLKMVKGVFQVLATGGDTNLGGDDFDALLVEELAKRFNLDFGGLNSSTKRLLVELAIEIKKTLSDANAVKLADLSKAQELSSSLLNSDNLSLELEQEFTRIEFNQLIKPLVQKTLMISHRVLKDAGLTNAEVGEVILVGGSTRVPLVREEIEKFFKKAPLCSLDPDQVVAMGAAIQANTLVGNSSDDYLLLDVIPLSLGIEIYGGAVEKIIPRNTAIPTARAQEFTTAQDNQTGMVIHVVQGERDLAADCRSLAKFSLKGLPPRAAGALKIRVTYQVDADGLLSVNATELTTGIQTEVQVQLSYGLTEDEVIKMIQDSYSFAELDVALRKLVDAITESELLVTVIKQQLAKYPQLLTPEEEENIRRSASHIEKLLAKYGLDNVDRSALTNEDAKRIKERANEIGF